MQVDDPRAEQAFDPIPDGGQPAVAAGKETDKTAREKRHEIADKGVDDLRRHDAP